MMITDFGIREFFVRFLVVVLDLALPLGIRFFLYKIYTKLKIIEELLKKD